MKAELSNEELLEHVKGALLASYTAVKGKGAEARIKVATDVDVLTIGDLTSKEALIEYFKASNLPLVLQTEELKKPVFFSDKPVYSAVADDNDGTWNMSNGYGMLPHGSIVGIANNPDPSLEDFVASGFLEFNSGNLFYAVKGGGAYIIERWAHGEEKAQRIRTSGTTRIENIGHVVADNYMLGNLAEFFISDVSRKGSDYACTGVNLSLLAAGSIDLFVFADNCINTKKRETGEEIGPLYLLVREAGGAMLSWNGTDLGPEKVGLDRKRTFDGLAAATEQLGRAYIQERMMKLPEIAEYISKL